MMDHLNYSRDLWDCVQLLETTTKNRAQKLYFVKDFVWSLRSILDTF